MLEMLDKFKEQLKEIDEKIAEGSIMKDMNAYKNIMQERSHISPIVENLQELQNIENEIIEAKQMINEETDSDMIEMSKQELKDLEERKEILTGKTKLLLIPKDPLDGKNIIMEIRAGTGGDEAALFASDLYKMYSNYSESNRWKTEIISVNETNMGGFKEIVFSISGSEVYGHLRWESGVHRVQRVPETESGGRVHTSAVTVAVLPEAEETDIEIKPEDLKIDVMRAGGPGGQCVNTTDSAVRMTHLPTGIVVIQQDEKSQLKNRAKALRVLRSRLFDLEEEKKRKERAENRKNQVGSGDRSERIRTYNFPQNRLTDHRINLTLYKLDIILQGKLDEVIEAINLAKGEEELNDN